MSIYKITLDRLTLAKPLKGIDRIFIYVVINQRLFRFGQSQLAKTEVIFNNQYFYVPLKYFPITLIAVCVAVNKSKRELGRYVMKLSQIQSYYKCKAFSMQSSICDLKWKGNYVIKTNNQLESIYEDSLDLNEIQSPTKHQSNAKKKRTQSLHISTIQNNPNNHTKSFNHPQYQSQFNPQSKFKQTINESFNQQLSKVDQIAKDDSLSTSRSTNKSIISNPLTKKTIIKSSKNTSNKLKTLLEATLWGMISWAAIVIII